MAPKTKHAERNAQKGRETLVALYRDKLIKPWLKKENWRLAKRRALTKLVEISCFGEEGTTPFCGESLQNLMVNRIYDESPLDTFEKNQPKEKDDVTFNLVFRGMFRELGHPLTEEEETILREHVTRPQMATQHAINNECYKCIEAACEQRYGKHCEKLNVGELRKQLDVFMEGRES